MRGSHCLYFLLLILSPGQYTVVSGVLLTRYLGQGALNMRQLKVYSDFINQIIKYLLLFAFEHILGI